MRHRQPAVGDLVIKTLEGESYSGIVREIALDRWGFQRNVWIVWPKNKPPPDYREKSGYSGINIVNGNGRGEYLIFRDGKEVR